MGSLRNIKSEAAQDIKHNLRIEWSKKFEYNQGVLLAQEFLQLKSDLNYFDYYRYLLYAYRIVRKDLPYFDTANNSIRLIRDLRAWDRFYTTSYGLIEQGEVSTQVSYLDYHEVVCYRMKCHSSWFQYWDGPLTKSYIEEKAYYIRKYL